MSVAHSFHAENWESGALTDAQSVTVYVVRVSDGVEVYGTAASPVALTRTSLGVYDLTSGVVFADATAYRSHYALLGVGETTPDTWTEDWNSGSPSALRSLVPAAWAYARVSQQVNALTDTMKAEIDRLLEAYTLAFEDACGRPLLRRVSEAVYFDPSDIDPEPGPLVLWRCWPVESIASVHLDLEHADAIDVVHDATTLLDPGDYRLLAPKTQPAPHEMIFRPGKRPDCAAPDAARAMKVVATFGYTPHDGTVGYTTPVGQHATPGPLAEALLRQVSIVWRRKDAIHQKTLAQSVPGGVGTSAFVAPRLVRSVREMIAPYATPEAALSLGTFEPGEENA